MSGFLRGSKERGYQSTTPICCPHCNGAVYVAGHATKDAKGPVVVLWAVAQKAGEYTEAELRHVRNGPPSEHTGVALPRPPGNVPFSDDPLPDIMRGDR